MTDENRSDLPAAEGAPAPLKSDSPKKSVAAAKEGAPPLIAPLATPFPTIPAPSQPKPGLDDELDAAEEILEISEADFEGAVGHDENRILKRWNAKLASVWMQGPGQVEALVEACRLLKWGAKEAGTPVSAIEAVIVKALPKVNLVLVAAAKAGAPGSIETWESGNGAVSFTISDILREAGMQVASGLRQRFPVKKVAKSPIGPAVAINLGAKPLESRHVETKRKKKS